MAEDCIFCRIVKKEIPATIVFENEHVLAFLDIAPAAKGHALVIPKNHSETLLETKPRDLKEAIVAVQKVAKVIAELTNADGFNIVESNKKAAGQVIPHLHFHIIPRKQGDSLSMGWNRIELDKQELQELGKLAHEKLKK